MIKYRPEIDGLRTIAVIPVILFHLSHNLLKGGYYGVDVFFVISGYLITKILTTDIKNGKFSMCQFWTRRVRRLLPLLLTVILSTIFITALFVFKPVVKDVSKDIFPAIFSYFNYHALVDFGDYWGGKSEQSFFLHTWSLSVEEQFYLFYPFFLFLSYKYFKNFIVPISIITIISIVLFFFFLYFNRDIAFYTLPTRIWELSVGGLAGLINLKNLKISKSQNVIPIIGMVFIFISYLLGHSKGSYTVVFPVIGSALIILFCTPNDLIGKLLSTKIFVFIGKLSYSLYLWHWGITVFFKFNSQLQNVNKFFLGGIIVSLTFILSYLSYTFIENKTRNYQHTPKIVLVGIALIAGLTLYLQSDFFNPYYNSKFNKQIVYFSYYNIAPKTNIPDTLNPFFYNVSGPLRLKKYNDSYKKEGIITNKKNGMPKIILIGDSHGVMWAKLLDEISNELNITLSCYTANANTPFFNIKNINSQEETKIFTEVQRIEYAKSVIENIEKWKPQIVVLATRWDGKIKDKRFNDMLEFLAQKNVKVLLLNQPPVLSFMGDNKNTGQYFTYLGIQPVAGYNLIEISDTSVIETNDKLKNIASKYINVSIYDVYSNMIENNKVKISLDNDVLYYDEGHLNYSGTLMHKENISSIIKTILIDNNDLRDYTISMAAANY